jgi:hypothetical protein
MRRGRPLELDGAVTKAVIFDTPTVVKIERYRTQHRRKTKETLSFSAAVRRIIRGVDPG